MHLSCQGERHWLRLRRTPGESAYSLSGERLLHKQDGLLSSHQLLRRGPALFIEWQGELREVRKVDPIAEAEASTSAGHKSGRSRLVSVHRSLSTR